MSVGSFSYSTASLPVPIEERSSNPVIVGERHSLAWNGEGFSNDLAEKRISPDFALTLSSYFACINVLSSDIASLPLKCKQRNANGTISEVISHPVNFMGWSGISPYSRPIIEGESTQFKVLQSVQARTLGRGNSYLRIYRLDGDPVEVRLIEDALPSRRVRDAGLYYKLDTGGTLRPEDVIHISGLGSDGLIGYSVARYAQECIRLGLSMESQGVSFYSNGSRLSGALKHPGKLSPESAQRLRDTWNAQHKGTSKAYGVAILEEGMEFAPFSISPEDAQFLSSRQFQVIEVARWFRMPPHKIGDLTQSHLANIEASNLDYLITVIAPWCRTWEDELNKKLFTREERASGLFVQFDMTSLLRGDMKGRGEYYQRLFGVGALSPNDIRVLEGLNRIEGGDRYFVPVNMASIDNLNQGAPPVD